MSHFFPFLGYLNTFVYEAWLFVNTFESLCCGGGKRRSRETEAEGDRGEKENSNNESKPFEGRDFVSQGLIIQNLSSVISETDVPR